MHLSRECLCRERIDCGEVSRTRQVEPRWSDSWPIARVIPHLSLMVIGVASPAKSDVMKEGKSLGEGKRPGTVQRLEE